MLVEKNLKSFIYFLLITTILFLSDQLSKLFFTNKNYFSGNFISISSSKNYGSAFSIFSSINFYDYFIIMLSLLILIVLFYLIFKYYFYKKFKFELEKNLTKNEKDYFIFSLTLIVSGILGNLIDRIVFGYVRDFLNLKYFFVFNLADSYLFLATIILIYLELKKTIKKNYST